MFIPPFFARAYLIVVYERVFVSGVLGRALFGCVGWFVGEIKKEEGYSSEAR